MASTALLQILLPVTDNDGKPFPDATLRAIQKELCDRFGGVTAYDRAPAEGIWRSGDGKEKDEIIIVEVMTDELDRDWWRGFKKRVEAALGQSELVVRAQTIERL